MLKTYQYRLYPSKNQERHLWQILACARHFDNRCVLEERSVSKNAQLRNVKHDKKTLPQAQIVHSHVLQVVAADCDKAFQAFFHRVKNGETPGYPRFKGHHRFHSIGFKQYLTYKAGSAGREVVLVDPVHTSKTCSKCGAIFAGLTLSDRWMACACGLSLDRGHNAAIHILAKALSSQIGRVCTA